ncbi:type III-B CRISPR module-associated Cmr3 family protein [Streptomyces sp. T028]|uniref:type III-B CRISPR module-associated Cmr3 family protein n=1 Tax=Streptomyces sp. T028 TaxID=3394379 RepID=UPI003A8821E8
MLDVTVTAHQPLALGVRPVGTAPVPTRLHVPGSVLRGALAAAWIAEHGLPTRVPATLREEFIALFEQDVCYGPLFAAGSQIVPLSVLRCKYRRCAVTVDEAFPDHGTGRTGHPEDGHSHPEPDHGGPGGDGEEPSCACGPLVPGRGDVEFTAAAAGPPVVQSTHLQIDDARQVAEERLLFTRRALTPHNADGTERTFHGRITPGTTLPEQVAAWLSRPRKLRLGGRRGTSGAVTYTPAPATGAPPATARTLALRLAAPAVLTDTAGLPLDLADHEALRRALAAQLDPLLDGSRVAAVRRVWARRERVGGWHAASRLPKPVELAVSAGSVLLLDFDQPPDPDRLLALSGHGIGLRRGEGFGAVTIAATAWQPAATDLGTTRPQPGAGRGLDLAESYARLLWETGHGTWFADQLRPLIPEPAAYRGLLLERPRLQRLPPSQRDALTALLAAPADVLDRALSILNVLNRLTERQPARP